MKKKILLTGSTGMVGRNVLENKDISKFELLIPNSKELNLLNYDGVDKYIKENTLNVFQLLKLEQ